MVASRDRPRSHRRSSLHQPRTRAVSPFLQAGYAFTAAEWGTPVAPRAGHSEHSLGFSGPRFTSRRTRALSHVRKAMKRRDKSEFDPPPSEGAPQSEDAFARGAGSTADEFETEDPGDADSAIEAPVPFSDLERRLADQEEKYLRLAAEYENYRKRTARER